MSPPGERSTRSDGVGVREFRGVLERMTWHDAGCGASHEIIFFLLNFRLNDVWACRSRLQLVLPALTLDAVEAGTNEDWKCSGFWMGDG